MRVMKVEVPNRGKGLMIMPDDNNRDEAEMLKRFSGGTLEVEGEGQDGITLFVWQKTPE
jgi:hypothetical protein